MSQGVMSSGVYRVDLEVDFGREDETGYVWAWLDEARDSRQVRPGAMLILRDGEDLAMAQVVDLVDVANGTIVHLDLLPGAVDDYRAAIDRATLT